MDGGIIEQDVNFGNVSISCIELANGALFDPLNPDPELMSLDVIAVALANQTRFAGHVSHFYSIAQHSVLVAALTDQDMKAQRCAILHDGDECFGLPDLPTPLKSFFPEYVKAQKNIGAKLDERYGITVEDHVRTKPADREALLLEKYRLKDLGNVSYWDTWSSGISCPEGIHIEPLAPAAALSLVEDAIERVFGDNRPINREWLQGRDGFVIN
jgi:hypothetical protein